MGGRAGGWVHHVSIPYVNTHAHTNMFCTYVHLYVCEYTYTDGHGHISMRIVVYLCMYVSTHAHICMYAFTCVSVLYACFWKSMFTHLIGCMSEYPKPLAPRKEL